MQAVYAASVNASDPLAAIEVGDVPPMELPAGWARIAVHATTVNHHDIWSLKGVGLSAAQTPMILGTDVCGVLPEDPVGATGLHAGSEVVAYTVVGSDGAGVLPGERRSILSERYPGTMATTTQVPAANLFAKPANLSAEEAAALGTSWLTAYSMLFSRERGAQVQPGDSVLIQGAGGGVSTAATMLARAAGLEVLSPRAAPPNAAARPHLARTPRSNPAHVCRTKWTPCSTRSVRPHGAIRSNRCAPAAPSSHAAPQAATSRARSSRACSSRTSASKATRWAHVKTSHACCASWNTPTCIRRSTPYTPRPTHVPPSDA